MSGRAVLYTEGGFWWLRTPGSQHPNRTGHTDRTPADRMRGLVVHGWGIEVDVQESLDLDLPEVTLKPGGLFG